MRISVTIVESRGDAVCLCVDELINSRGVQVLQEGCVSFIFSKLFHTNKSSEYPSTVHAAT